MQYKTLAFKKIRLHFFQQSNPKNQTWNTGCFNKKAAGYLEGRLIKVWFSLINEG